MRRRLLAVLALFSITIVASWTLPLLKVAGEARAHRFALSRSADLDRFTALTQAAMQSGDTRLLSDAVTEYHSLYGEGVLVVDRRKQPVAQAGFEISDPGVGTAVEAILRNEYGSRPSSLGPWSDQPIMMGEPVGVGTDIVGAVILRAQPAAAAEDIARSWRMVLIGSAILLLACAAVAVLLARWVEVPVAELSRGIGSLMSGSFPRLTEGGGPPELRALISTFNQMAEALFASAEQQRRLVADTSHQVRSPLAALRLRVDTLDGHVDDGGLESYRRTTAELDRLETMLDGLLTLASAESRAIDRAVDVASGTASSDTCELTSLVAEQIALWSPAGVHAGVALHPPEPGPRIVVACSADELAQVLDVLLDNATKYAGPGAQLWTSCRAGAGTALLEVRDSGPGLPPEHLARATERFWRSPDVGADRGTGLGLTIAERLVVSRGGELRLRTAPEGGLAVSVELPTAPPR